MTQWGGVLEEALYIANTDGNDVTEIATIAARGVPVFWSPDGSQILFEDVDAQICRYHVETGEVECNFAGFYPIWDSRGEQIAYLDFDGRLCVSAGLTAGKFELPERTLSAGSRRLRRQQWLSLTLVESASKGKTGRYSGHDRDCMSLSDEHFQEESHRTSLYRNHQHQWAAKPLRTMETLLACIRRATRKRDCKCLQFLIEKVYVCGIKITDEAMESLY